MLIKYFVLLISAVLINTAFAKTPENNLKTTVKNNIERIELHDQIYIKRKGPAFFKHISVGQKPLFTIVTCSDSRVQASILDDNPEGNYFIVRNIGNQLITAHINAGVSDIVGVIQNVDNQVDAALKKYATKIKNNQLMVIGAVYDFADEMLKGSGELLIININGETNPAILKKILNIKTMDGLSEI